MVGQLERQHERGVSAGSVGQDKRDGRGLALSVASNADGEPCNWIGCGSIDLTGITVAGLRIETGKNEHDCSLKIPGELTLGCHVVSATELARSPKDEPIADTVCRHSGCTIASHLQTAPI